MNFDLSHTGNFLTFCYPTFFFTSKLRHFCFWHFIPFPYFSDEFTLESFYVTISNDWFAGCEGYFKFSFSTSDGKSCTTKSKS